MTHGMLGYAAFSEALTAVPDKSPAGRHSRTRDAQDAEQQNNNPVSASQKNECDNGNQ